MDFLRKKLQLLAIILCLAPFAIYAQNEKTIDAFSQSHAYEKSGEYSKAIEALKAVYDPNSYEINLRLGWLNYSAGLFTESAAYYNKAITLMPYSIEPKLGIALPLSALGKTDDMINQYKLILDIDPKNTLVNYRMGAIYYGKTDYATAYKYLEKGINLYPFDYDYLVLFGWTNYKLGKYREAKILFYKALLNKPTDKSAKEGYDLIK
jgi:tetratricopeptide (TPR) repeat protein